MSSIDDILEGIGDHARFVEYAKAAPKGILFYNTEADKWAVSFHGVTLGDLGYCIAALQAEFAERYNGCDEGGE